jgi:hypothetical protein
MWRREAFNLCPNPLTQLYFYVQQRQPQMAAVRFPRHLRLLPDRRRSPSPLAKSVNQVGAPQMNRVLAELQALGLVIGGQND